jgi:hypothetical protein
MMGAQAGTERPMIAQLELTQQVLIPDQYQGEGGLAGQVQSQEQTKLLQRAVRTILGVVQNDHQGLPVVLGKVAGEFIQVAFAAHAGPLAHAPCQAGQETAAAQSGLGEVDRSIEPVLQLSHPPADQRRFTHAIAPA